MIYKNILQLIGHTPMVKVNKLNSNKNINIYAKLEGQNPGGWKSGSRDKREEYFDLGNDRADCYFLGVRAGAFCIPRRGRNAINAIVDHMAIASISLYTTIFTVWSSIPG